MLGPRDEELEWNASLCYDDDVIRPKIMSSALTALGFPDALTDDTKSPIEKIDLLIWKMAEKANDAGTIDSPVSRISNNDLQMRFHCWNQSFEVQAAQDGVLPLTNQMRLDLRTRMKALLGAKYLAISSTMAGEQFWVKQQDIQAVYQVTRQNVLLWRNSLWWPKCSPYGANTWYSTEVTKAINDQPKLSKTPVRDWRDVCTPSQLVRLIDEYKEEELKMEQEEREKEKNDKS